VSAIGRPQIVGEQDRIASEIAPESHAQCSTLPSKRRPIRSNTICAKTDRERGFAVDKAVSWLNDVVLRNYMRTYARLQIGNEVRAHILSGN
jgi:hypothetical protein